MILKLVTFDNELIEPTLANFYFILFYFAFNNSGETNQFLSIDILYAGPGAPTIFNVVCSQIHFFFHRLRKQYQVDLGLE